MSTPEERRELKMLRRAYRASQHMRKVNLKLSEGQRCQSCKQVLPRAMFSASIVRGRRYLHHRCITCRARYYTRSPAAKAKRALLDELRSKPCVDCGKNYAPHAMVFDHVRGLRRFNVSGAWTGRSVQAITEEAGKCDIVCAICLADRKKRRRDRGLRRHFKLAELPTDLAAQVDLAARLRQLYGDQSVATSS